MKDEISGKAHAYTKERPRKNSALLSCISYATGEQLLHSGPATFLCPFCAGEGGHTPAPHDVKVVHPAAKVNAFLLNDEKTAVFRLSGPKYA